MQRFIAIASNAFMELIRQPIFLLLITSSAAFSLFLASIPYFGSGDDPKMVKDSVLAVMLLAGLLGAVLSASHSLAREIHAGTALAVLAKPVGRAQFLLAKYLGVAGVLAVLTYVGLLAALLASRMAFDAYGDTDWWALSLFMGMLVLAYAMGGFSNFFLRRPFVSDAVLSVVAMSTVAFIVINFINKEGQVTFQTTDFLHQFLPFIPQHLFLFLCVFIREHCRFSAELSITLPPILLKHD